MIDFDRLCSLRLILWEIFLKKKEAEAYENARGDQPRTQAPLVIPEIPLQQNIN